MSENQVIQLPGSLSTDTSKNNQPEGTHSFALNAISETNSGDRGFVSSEPGNTQCINIDGFILVGSIPLVDNQTILFLATQNQSNSKIILQTGCNSQTVVETSCLNFNDKFPVTGVAKIRKGCNRVIYFRDSFNSDRSIDIDEILNNPLDNRYYDGTWHCELLKLAPDFTFPCIDYISTNNTGGNLQLGVYQFAIALGDEDLNFSNVIEVTQPIPIVHGQLNGNVNNIEGGDPLLESATNKSISLQFTNLDLDYQYVKVYAIETVAGVTSAYEAAILSIDNSTINYTYTGVDANSAVVVSIDVINNPFIVYDKSKTMEQHDQRLIRANLTSRDIDHSVFQRAANLVTVRYVTKPIKYLSNSSVFSGDYYVDNRTYMRDEIYALSIQAVFTDGSNTPEYHIPGRLLDTSSTGSTLPLANDPFAQNGSKQHNRKDPINGWDSTLYNVVNGETYPQFVGSTQDWNILYNNNTNTFFQLAPNEVHIEDVKPFNINVGDTIERWKVYNTAYIDEQYTLNDSIYSRGQLAYWESELPYPITEDCGGNRIFPTGNIRHHKMPDTTLEPHFINNGSDDYILSLGLEFDIVAFKAFLQSNLGSDYNEIAGFKISRAKRDRGNKSILDKGLAFRGLEFLYDRDADTSTDQEQYLLQCDLFNKHSEIQRSNSRIRFHDFPVDYGTSTIMPDENVFGGNRDDQINGIFRHSYEFMIHHNPNSKFNKDDSLQYIKTEKELFGKYTYWGDDVSWTPNTNSRASFWVVYNNYHTNGSYKGTPMPYFTNRISEGNLYIDSAQNGSLNNFRVINATQQEALYSAVDNFPDISNDGIAYGGGPIDFFGSRRNTSDDTVTISGAGIANYYSKAYYNSLKAFVPSQYGQLYSLTYYPIHTCLISTNTDTTELFGGDCFISQFTYRKTYTDDDFADNYGDERTWWTNLVTYFVESEINTKLRHESYTNDTAKWYYPYHGTNNQAIFDVMFDNDYQSHGPSNDDVIDNYVQGQYDFNQYNYNQDYSKEQELRPNFPLALGYDYCGLCVNTYPYRIIYSEQSFQEDTSDAYRRFPANNYRDLQANTGEIFNIFRQGDELYARTLQSLWFIPTKQQQLQTDQATIQIGTGDFFSLPPKELESVNVGYNGGQTSLDLITCEYGTFYADSISGIVFMLKGGQQRPISTISNRLWFNYNLPFKILESNPEFPLLDSPTSRSGVGLIGYFDPEHKRYILTKRDYIPLYPDTSSYNSIEDIWIVGIEGRRGITNIEVSEPYNSPQYFENKSWTISYNLEDNKWVSWHSYLPNFAYNNRHKYYTYTRNNNYIWKHNDNNYTNYYGIQNPFIIEYVNTKDALNTKIINSINYIANVQQYDANRKNWLDIKNETFTQGLFYNDTQSTGKLDLILKNNIDPFASVLGTFDPSEILVERTESNWNINNIRDMVDQTNPEQAIFSSNWNDLSTQYYIDKVPNSNIINYLTKSQFEMEPMRDNYLAARLFYTPSQDRRITVKFINNNYDYSIR